MGWDPPPKRPEPEDIFRYLARRAEEAAKASAAKAASDKAGSTTRPGPGSNDPPLMRFKKRIDALADTGHLPRNAIRDVQFIPSQPAGNGTYLLTVLPARLKTRRALMPLGFSEEDTLHFDFYEMMEWQVPTKVMEQTVLGSEFADRKEMAQVLHKVSGHEHTLVVSTPFEPNREREDLKPLAARNIILWVRRGVSRSTLVKSDDPEVKKVITLRGVVCKPTPAGGKEEPYEQIVIPEALMPAVYRDKSVKPDGR